LKARVISILLALSLLVSGFIGIKPNKAFAAEKSPDILITEIMPAGQNGDDPYEYIELYNNSENSINLRSYKFVYPDANINISKTIQPKGTMVVCMRGSTTRENFNKFYGTSLTSDMYMTLPFTSNVLDNDTARSVILVKDDSYVVSMAKYETSDFETEKGVTYKYPETGLDMIRIGQKQQPTPGAVDSNQVPNYGIRVTGISLDRNFLNLNVGKTAALTATVTPASAQNKKVIWTSSNPNIAYVGTNGVVTARAIGAAIITAKTEDGGFTAFCTLLVSNVSVIGVVLDKSYASVDVNSAFVLTAKVLPDAAGNKQITWMSDIAVVDQNGIVYGKSAGTAIITVKTVEGGYTDTCKVTVNSTNGYIPVTGISLDKKDIKLDLNRAVVITAKVNPSNATNKNVEWRSSNTNVASVDDNGIVFAKTLGTATITVITEDGNYSANCKVMVTNTPDTSVPVTGIKLNEQALIMELKETETLKATVLPSDAVNKDVTWYSNDSSIVSVDQNGKLTALKEGVATITVTTEEGSYTAKCIVVVIKEDDHDDDDDDDDDDDKDKDEHPALSIKMNKTTLKMKDQQRYTLKAIVTPGVGRVTKLNWKSSNTSVAIVDNNGTVTPKGTGTAIITASTPDGKLSCQCTVTVYMSKSKGKGKK